MNTVKVRFGDRSYDVQELPTRLNELWRGELEEQLEPIIDIIKGLAREELSVDNVGNLAGPVEQVTKIAMGSPVTIREMALSYSEELEADREWLLDNSYDSEFVEAFIKILGLAYPFGGMVKILKTISQPGS